MSHDQSCTSELTASEVEELLRSTRVHSSAHPQNYCQSYRMKEDQNFCNNQEKGDRLDGHGLRSHRDHSGTNMMMSNIKCRENYLRGGHCCAHKESHYRKQEVRFKGLKNHHCSQKDGHHSSYQVRNCIQEDWPVGNQYYSINRTRANGCFLPISQNQDGVLAFQQQLYSTPASYIPLSDYISMEEEKLYCWSHDGSPAMATDSSSTHSRGTPSPLYEDDTLYTILNIMDTTEPITAIFMGFQTAQDEYGQAQEFESFLKAELVIINNDDSVNYSIEAKNNLGSNGCKLGSNGKSGHEDVRLVVESGEKWKKRWVGSGIRKTKKKHRTCCTIV